jgi:hypothetical protein
VTTTNEPFDPVSLLADIANGLGGIFAEMEWTEDEIAKAAEQYPDHADAIYHAFPLLHLRQFGDVPHIELTVRSHVRELLDRLAAGEDTRPGTAAEVCMICSQMSLIGAPLTEVAAGLYFRCFAKAFPDIESPGADSLEHYEALHGPEIDELERRTRRNAADPARTLDAVDCDGRHHGEQVDCRYASAPLTERGDE